ncbi:MAG: c-type cytochrome [Chloroflexota bacterium]
MARILLVALLSLSIVACGRQPSPENGRNLAVLNGCTACHSTDGAKKLAPTWQGLYGSEVTLANGSTLTADETYLVESIANPAAKIVMGYTEGAMPPFDFTEDEIADIVAYIKSLTP